MPTEKSLISLVRAAVLEVSKDAREYWAEPLRGDRIKDLAHERVTMNTLNSVDDMHIDSLEGLSLHERLGLCDETSLFGTETRLMLAEKLLGISYLSTDESAEIITHFPTRYVKKLLSSAVKFPHDRKWKEYGYGVIPAFILERAILAQESGVFSSLEIWTKEKQRLRDPVMTATVRPTTPLDTYCTFDRKDRVWFFLLGQWQ